MAPNAPTKRKMSCALHRAWAAVKIGISRTGVPTKRRRSRQRSSIQGEGLVVDEGDALVPERPAGLAFVGANVVVDMIKVDNSKGIGRQVFPSGEEQRQRPLKSKRRVAFLPPA